MSEKSVARTKRLQNWPDHKILLGYTLLVSLLFVPIAVGATMVVETALPTWRAAVLGVLFAALFATWKWSRTRGAISV